jgi:hypothetical protein
MSKIFISYSSKDREWVSNWLLPKLEKSGLEVCIDYRDFKIGRSSLINMEVAVDWCYKILLVLTPDWVESEWTNFEALMVQTEDIIGLRGRLLPLMLKQCELPRRLGIFTYADFKDESNWDFEMSRLLEQLGIKVPKDKTGPERAPLPLKPGNISTCKLPTTGPKLFGREKELERLDAAWKDEHTCLVTLIAWGGVGKTALVNHWLNMMGKDNYCGANKVYGWSFYSQGAEEGKQASADEFLYETLKWFGDPHPEQGTSVEKGRRLARLVGKEKTLLILDGMEPLQYPPGEVHGLDGKLKDQGMRAFLRELTGCGPGLCVITSRERVTDLEDKIEFSVKEMLLEHLSPEAGALLLRNLGVAGTGKEIEKAVEEYDGHALALTLLGQYIKSVFKGDIRKRDRIPKLTLERRQGRHARRVMEAYARWLGESPERDILYIMGLFDRPVEMGAIEALKTDPPIPEVTDQLQQLSEEDWGYALDNLRGANLLAKEDPQKPDTLDCHPLIREHFGERFQQQNPKGWKEAHKRLYHYFKNLPEKELPDTLPEMEPLFAAVSHGCKAVLHQETEVDVYWKRISKVDEHYIKKKLGAFSADLSVLSHFFEKPWSQPASGLPEDIKALVLSWSAFGLRAAGMISGRW